ncbi:MAG: YbjN domain-containing protein [Clostridia bacterium]|nr:YbjN domain-containing protein [Clostridia bacterium]
MADELLARRVYDRMVELLPDSGIKNFTKNEEKLNVRFTVNGDDIPMDFIMRVIPNSQLISLLSFMPFDFKSDRMMEGAIAVTAINDNILNGSFCLDMSDGTTYFNVYNSYIGTELSVELLRYLIGISVNTVDDYNDRLLALNKSIISIEDFLKWINENNE